MKNIPYYVPEVCDGQEEWKPIAGYEGLYEVSNLGRVRRSTWKLVRGKSQNGYIRINLYKNGEQKAFLVHRLVAAAFAPNEKGYKIINHMDECPSNNRADNLEWCTQKHNMNWGTVKDRERMNNPLRKRVMSIDIKTGTHEYFNSISEAYDSVVQPGKRTGSISEALSGKRKSAYGRYWFYLGSEEGEER